MSDGYIACLLSCKPCEGCGQHIPKNRTYCEKCTPDATAGDGLLREVEAIRYGAAHVARLELREAMVRLVIGYTQRPELGPLIADALIAGPLRDVLAAAARDAEKVRRVEELVDRTQRYAVDNSEPGDPLTPLVQLRSIRRALDGTP